MRDPTRFNWRHFAADSILGACGDPRDALGSRDGEALLRERGGRVDHTTVFRRVQRDALALDQRRRPHLHITTDSHRVDEPSIKMKKPWHDLDRAGDAQGQTLAFLLRPTRDADAAERFFRQALRASHALTPG
jgi:IS6 family transposase